MTINAIPLKDYLTDIFEKNKVIKGYKVEVLEEYKIEGVEEIYQQYKKEIWELINELAAAQGIDNIIEFIRAYVKGLDKIKFEIDLHSALVKFVVNYYLKRDKL